MNKKKIAIAIVALTILTLAGTIGVGKILAEDVNNYPPIISKLVERFGLNEDEVKSVFDEARQEHQAQMQVKFEEKLNQAVNDGKISQEQKNKILAKHEEMCQNKENWQSLSKEEKREKARELKEEIKNWAEAEGINLKDVLGFGIRFGRRHFGRGFGLGFK